MRESKNPELDHELLQVALGMMERSALHPREAVFIQSLNDYRTHQGGLTEGQSKALRKSVVKWMLTREEAPSY